MDLNHWMQKSLHQASLGLAQDEVPIGAVIVYQNKVLALSHNHCEAKHNALEHAEMRVLNQVLPHFERDILQAATLYVTLEPCPMCMGAILHSHIGRLVFGGYNLKWGACGTVIDFLELFPQKNLEVIGGIEELDCTAILQTFFQAQRKLDL